MNLTDSFITWYNREFAWLHVTITASEILQIQESHLLILQYGYRFVLFRQQGEGFTEVFDAGTDRAKAVAELKRREDPSVYWTVPEKIQQFTDAELGALTLKRYNEMMALARPWNLQSACIRGKLKAMDTLTVAQLESGAAEYFQQSAQPA